MEGVYLVGDAYHSLMQRTNNYDLFENFVFKEVLAPSKVKALVWKMLLNRI